MLALHHLAPWHWALAGLAIAAITLALQWLGNRSLGLSSGLEDLCSLASRDPTFQRTAAEGRSWRLPFLGGLFLGGLLSALLAGGVQPTWRVEPLDSFAQLSGPAKVAWFFVGGVCSGFGTRLAGGCTSGHGIFGMARLQPGSIAATLAFMTVGTLTANLLYRVVFS
jgi:uncharacterized membrane protein YedE/YeeE